MIHWSWLIGAFIAGEMVGIVLMAICASQKKQDCKYIKK